MSGNFDRKGVKVISTHCLDDDACRPPVDCAVSRSRAADQQILELACQALRTSGYTQLRQVQVSLEQGRVTLKGELPTYYLKQVAQSVIQDVAGVREIDNDVRVLS